VQNFSKSLEEKSEEKDNKNPEGILEVEKKNDNMNLAELNKIILDQAKKKTNKDQQKINKEYIISASRDKTIKIWDVFASSCIYTLNGHDNWVRAISIHPNGKYLISCSDDKSIRFWDLKTARCAKKIQDAHERFVVSLAIGIKFPLMASGSNDQVIKIWDCK
jgi:platelet-activating factor acetylhydrolase IB subunit alpha